MTESHIVSARKFRPQTFSQIVGQRHIVRTLTNTLQRGRVAHAYLFSGTRGVGKTTTARILAKALNCVEGPTAEPCLKCHNCLEIASGSSIDVMEIDGASNTGVDNIRDLKESVMFSPTKSKYKIYIIDEVHQISKAAFNALLKTLEEPPAHVIFIFATTELNKVPETILSRCQCFEYKSISMGDIVTQLTMIAEREKIEVTPGAIQTLARRARGSMRDAQSMFDQAAAYGGGAVNEEDVKLILGLVDSSTLFRVMDTAIAADRAALLESAGGIAYSGADPGLFMEDLAATVRNVMVAKFRPGGVEGGDPGEAEKLAEWAAALEYDELQRFFAVIIDTMEQIKYSANPALSMEMGLLKLTEKRGLVNIHDVIGKIEKAQTVLERRVASSNPAPARAAAPSSAAPVEARRVPQEARPEPSGGAAPEVEPNLEPAPEEIQKSVSGGGNGDLLGVFQNIKPSFIGMLDGAAVQVKGDTVVIVVDNIGYREFLDEAENKALLEKAAARELGRPARVVVEFHDQKKKSEGPGRMKVKERMESLHKQVVETPIIQEAMEIFNGDNMSFTPSKSFN